MKLEVNLILKYPLKDFTEGDTEDIISALENIGFNVCSIQCINMDEQNKMDMCC